MKDRISTIKKRYRAMPIPVRAAFWFTICSFIQRGISMITTPIFTRLLSAEEYGLYSTYLSWETVILMLITLNLYKAIMNLYIKYEENQEQTLSAICGLEFTLSFIWLVVGCFFRERIAALLGMPSVLVCCLFIYCMFQAVFQCWFLYKRYVYDYKLLLVVTLIIIVGTSLLGVFAVACISATATARVVSSVFVISIVGITLYGHIFIRNKRFYDRDIWLFSLGFCVPLLPHYLSEFILQSSDKIMINYMCGPGDVAVYSIAYAVGSLINLVTNAINSSFAPYQYQKIKSKEYNILAKRTNQVLLFVGVILACVMLFSREIVLLFGGYKYEESITVIIPICLGIYFNYMFQIFARIQEYYERKISVAVPSIMCATLNLILNYIFIKIYGYKAAAYTTFVCYFLFCIIHYFFYRKVCREILHGEELYDIKGLAQISLSVISIGIVIFFLSKVLWLKYGLIAGLIIIAIRFRKKMIRYIKEIAILTS